MKDNIFETKDKHISPFLFTQLDISYIGVRKDGYNLYFQFTPHDKCQQLVNDFVTRKAPLVQPKDLLDAVETYRDRVFEMKDKNYVIQHF